MRLTFVCLNADMSSPVHATTVRWIDALAARPEVDHLTVLTLDGGRVPQRPGLVVRTFRRRHRLSTTWQFYREVARVVRQGTDAFLVYQGGPYPLLLWPIKLTRGIPIYYWKAHPHISGWTRLSARAATRVFTSTPAAFPLALPHVVVVGQGVDVKTFTPRPQTAGSADLVTVGRIAPVKRLDQMIHAVARHNDRFGARVRLDIYGPTLPEDGGHERRLRDMTGTAGLSDLVTFKGPVMQDDLPPLLGGYRLFLNFSKTALDRTVVEAMACGLPVLSTNQAVAQMLPPRLRDALVVPEDDLDAQAEGIHRLLSLDAEARADLSAAVRALIVKEHNLESLIGRIVQEMGSRR